jgi:hypothetical protein
VEVGSPARDDDLEELVDRELAPRRSRLGLVALGVGGTTGKACIASTVELSARPDHFLSPDRRIAARATT